MFEDEASGGRLPPSLLFLSYERAHSFPDAREIACQNMVLPGAVSASCDTVFTIVLPALAHGTTVLASAPRIADDKAAT